MAIGGATGKDHALGKPGDTLDIDILDILCFEVFQGLYNQLLQLFGRQLGHHYSYRWFCLMNSNTGAGKQASSG